MQGLTASSPVNRIMHFCWLFATRAEGEHCACGSSGAPFCPASGIDVIKRVAQRNLLLHKSIQLSYPQPCVPNLAFRLHGFTDKLRSYLLNQNLYCISFILTLNPKSYTATYLKRL